MTRPRKEGSSRLFWRVYLHGITLLLAIVTAVVVVGLIVGHPPLPRIQRHLGRLIASGAVSLDDRESLTDTLAREREMLGSKITIYRLDGTLLATNQQVPFPPLSQHQVDHLVPGMRVNFGWLRFAHAVPLPDAKHTRAYALLAPALAPVLERLGAIALAILLTLAIVSIPLARAISSPIDRLTQAAKALGEGDLSVRSGLSGDGEVGHLAAAFDEMADRLQRLVRQEQDLLANVSHELRTPLARIRVALDLAIERPQPHSYLRDIEANVKELEQLVEDVLVGARLNRSSGDGGLPALRLELLDPRAFLEDIAARFRRQYPDRQLKVWSSTPLGEFRADRELFRRALNNVLDNAVKYSDATQPILLSGAPKDEGILFEVSDKGIGIESADLPKLFTPFFRTDRSRARGTGGVGLGLLLSKRIVTAHGGSISLQSAPGLGTTIQIWVPATPALAHTAEAPASAGGGPSHSTKDFT